MDAVQAGATWSTVGAKAKLSALIEQAQHVPQIITCHGKPSVVVVSIEEWQRKTQRKGSLVDFLRASPLSGVELTLERVKDAPQDKVL